MKNIRKDIERWLDNLDKGWDQLSLEKQHQYILYFFTAYLLLTAWIIFKIWYDSRKFHQTIVIEHIENAAFKENESAVYQQDKGSTTLKNKIYERK
ncbi:nitrogen regulatory IIA protein [Flavobacterium sp. GSB-24]|uniref:nitrogen regulatory IIA protein n=1 Tax=Flavobacterium sp. GSB-24 TaxID=2994319 RepID=UPI002493478B|nr:nitrogen regulatory IIA protein [Flavobacterium sp. GSB-24]BDU25198.1 hypothetical protein FLGSB24_19420 [Flavobacterium sp. GSB-24]